MYGLLLLLPVVLAYFYAHFRLTIYTQWQYIQLFSTQHVEALDAFCRHGSEYFEVVVGMYLPSFVSTHRSCRRNWFAISKRVGHSVSHLPVKCPQKKDDTFPM